MKIFALHAFPEITSELVRSQVRTSTIGLEFVVVPVATSQSMLGRPPLTRTN